MPGGVVCLIDSSGTRYTANEEQTLDYLRVEASDITLLIRATHHQSHKRECSLSGSRSQVERRTIELEVVCAVVEVKVDPIEVDV